MYIMNSPKERFPVDQPVNEVKMALPVYRNYQEESDEPGAAYTTAETAEETAPTPTLRRPRKTSITPHERRRKQRMISFTFPSPAWTRVIRDNAEALGLGPSEFATRVFAQALAAIERGEWDPEAEEEWSPEEPETGDLWT